MSAVVAAQGLELTVEPRAPCPVEDLRLGASMLWHLLSVAGFCGQFRFAVFVTHYPALPRLPQYQAQVAQLGKQSAMLRVALRFDPRKKLAISGVLYLPPGLDGCAVIEILNPLIARFNQSGWQEAIAGHQSKGVVSHLSVTFLETRFLLKGSQQQQTKSGVSRSPSVLLKPSSTATKGRHIMDAVLTPPSISMMGNLSDFQPQVIDRAEAMLLAALGEAAVESGTFRFQVERVYPELERQSKPHMEILPSAALASGIVVRLKATGGPGSALAGLLRLPEGMDRRQLLADLKPGIENFNGSAWEDVFVEVAPGARPEKTRAASSAGSPVDVKKVPPVVPPVSSPLDQLSDRDAKLARVLLTLLGDARVQNGVFISGFFTLEATKVLPEERKRGWIITTMAYLKGKGWIQPTTDRGQYQVSVEFAQKYAAGVKIQPVAQKQRPHNKPSKIPGRQNGAVPPVESGSHIADLQELFRRRSELDGQIADSIRQMEQDLVRVLENARSDLAAQQATVDRAEAALAEHRERYADVLGAPT